MQVVVSTTSAARVTACVSSGPDGVGIAGFACSLDHSIHAPPHLHCCILHLASMECPVLAGIPSAARSDKSLEGTTSQPVDLHLARFPPGLSPWDRFALVTLLLHVHLTLQLSYYSHHHHAKSDRRSLWDVYGFFIKSQIVP